ncbi:hypothetical protein D3OALGA1CA_3945 [Olavius algarvensis associated proteobacterium Delta 3]|nr:hypothetical protein D3OALGA1CA_3945 [Olavius algarvensis associated proteobacterium Delta 3]
MSGWLKSTAQKLIKYIQHGGPRNPEKAPDRKPTASTGTDSFSVGIHFEALEPRILLSGSGEGTLAGNALQANHEISQNAIEMELLTSHDQNLRLASDFLNTSEADEGTSGSSGDSSSRVVRDAAHDGLSPDNQRSQDIIATSTVLSTDKNQTMDVISGESFDTLTAMDRPQLDTTETGERRELVFVDAGVDNYRELIGDLLENQDGRASIDVFVLDPVRGGVEQINDLLAEHENLDALHVVSHGSDGSVKLGDTWLDNENLDAYADDIAVWQRSLSEGADLLFYGCDLAGGQEGRELLDALGALTGADVAASVDDTGHVVLGGDWDLEYRTGDIETAVAFSTEVQGRWTGLLAETVHESYETGTDSLEIWDGQSWGQTFEDTDGAGNYTVNRISLWMMENSSANKTVIVSLRSSWDGANLASATIASGLLSDGVFVRQDFDFSDVTLSYNTTYYLRIDYASASGKVFVETDASGSYSRGDLLDNGTAQSGDMRFRISEVTITLPTLTTFTGPIDTTAEDTEVEITLADLKAQGDEADSDGTVDGFVVKAITTGTLKIGSSAGAATAWVLGTNDTIDANNHAYWTPAQDANGTLDAFEVVAQDNDGAESVTAGVIARVNVNPVNDAPTLVGTAANPTATESGTGTNQVALIQAGTGGATDVDALNFDGGTITVTLDAYRPGDRLSVLGSPTGVGSISGGDVAALVITLNSGATPANLGAILEALRFENTGDNPTVGGSDTDRVYNIVLNDGGNTPAPAETSNTLTGTITVTGENDAPTATNLNAAETYIEDTALNLTDIVVNDVDSGSVTATLTLSDTAVGILTTGSSGSVTSTFNAGTGEWRASGAIADVNALLASVAFVPTPNYNSNFAIDTSVDDGVAPALTGVKNMTGTPVNDAPTITAVAGPTEADEDTAYDLDLSFTDPDDSAVTWTVNWGDGTITSAASTGVTTTVAHTYARSGFTYNILVSANDGEDTVLQNELLVPTLGPDSIFRYEETTGGFLQEFAAANGLNNAVQVVVGPDGNIYVTGETSGNVLRYNAVTWAFIDEFISGPNVLGGLAFGPDGHLYVSSHSTDEVLRYDGTSGAFIDDFVTAASGGLDRPYGLTFGPDGNLYVGSYSDNQVLRYDGATGEYIDVFVSSDSGGLSTPEQMIFGPDGHLYIASFDTNEVLRYDGGSGAFIDVFAAAGPPGGLNRPTGLAFGPDGNLYVSDFSDAVILRYDGTTGAFMDEYVTAAGNGGLAGPAWLSFLPEQRVLVRPFADTPTVTNTTTNEDTQSSSGLVISRNAADGAEVTHFKITGIVNGTLYRNDGSTVINDGDFIPFSEGTLGLKFTPSLDFNGLATFNVQASTTGNDTDLSPVATASITVNPVNDAPTLTGANDLSAIDEDPVSNPGTLVSDLISGQTSDPDAASLEGIAVFFVDDASGTWQYSTDGGTNWLAFGSVDASSARLLAADANTYVRFVPDADWNGTVTNGITFHAWDRTSGSNGGNADLTSTYTVRDEFSIPSYSNDNGTASWAGPWVETNDNGLPSSGQVQITGGELSLDNHDFGSFESATRAVNLSGAISATLDFDFRILGGIDSDDSVVIEISSNGGTNWVTLENFTGYTAATSGSRSFDIGAYATSDTRIGFRINNEYRGASEYFRIDNLQIAYTSVGGTGGTSAFSAASASSSISVNPVNDAPTATNLNAAQTYTEDTSLNLTDIVVSDVDSPNVTVTLTLSDAAAGGLSTGTSGSVTSTFAGGMWTASGAIADVNTLLANVTFNPTSDYNSDFDMTASVDDGVAASVTGVKNITGTPVNDPPAITSDGGGDTAAISIDENTSAVTTVTATDADGDTPKFSITGGTDAGLFGIDTNTGVLTFNAAPDFENPGDSNTDNTYVVQVTADDENSGTDVQTLSITVNPVNDNAPVFTSAAAATVDEGQTVVHTLTAADADLPAQAVGFTITGGADQGRFSIDGSNQLIFNAAPDYENPVDAGTNNDYEVEVTANDGNGGTNTQTITVTVNPVNDNAPVFTSAAAATVDEGQTIVHTLAATDADLPAQTVGYTITGGADQGRFSIDGSNQLIFNAAPDYENPVDADTDNIYEVEVTASDGSGGTTTQTINVTVNPVNDNAPVMTSASAANIDENQTVVHTLAATDTDLPAQTVGFTITGGADQGRFSINGSNQLVFTAAPDYENPVDADTDNIYEVEVTANDGAGNTTTQTINVTVNPVNDNAPAFTSAAAASIDENQTVVHTLTATDVDLPAQAVGFTITGGADQGWFSINGSNELVFTAAPDYENPVDADTDNVYEVQVTANDGSGGTTVQSIGVTVNNGPEPPTASNLNTSETYTEDIPLNLNDMVISDVDSATVTVTMTLSDLTAGTLSTGTSGTVTSTFSAGVWTASGTISDVNALLASAVFTPTADYNSNFTITVTADDGTTPPLVGVKNMTGTPVNDGVTPPPDDDPIDDPGPEEDPSDTTDPDPEDDPGDGDDEEDTGEEDPLDEGGTEDGTVDSDLSPVRQNGAQKSAVAKTFRAFSNAEGSNLKLAGFANMDLNTVVEFLLSREASSPEPAAIVQAVEQFFNQRGFDPLSALEYEFLMNSLDELKREATSEVQFQDIVASSAIAVTSGLSVGYVIWLIRSGILLSSFLSSMPAWQILDPLPILAGKREDAEDDDEESLETILKKGPQNSEKNDKIKNASSGTMKVMG